MRIILLGFAIGICLVAVTFACSAAHLISDPLTPGTTHCGINIDTVPPAATPPADVVVPVTPAASVPAPHTPPAGTIVCYYDLSGVVAGPHTGKGNAQQIDPNGIFATTKSVYSNTANFTVPGVSSAPGVVRLIP